MADRNFTLPPTSFSKMKIMYHLLKIIFETLSYHSVLVLFELNFNLLFALSFDKAIFSFVEDNLSECQN